MSNYGYWISRQNYARLISTAEQAKLVRSFEDIVGSYKPKGGDMKIVERWEGTGGMCVQLIKIGKGDVAKYDLLVYQKGDEKDFSDIKYRFDKWPEALEDFDKAVQIFRKKQKKNK